MQIVHLPQCAVCNPYSHFCQLQIEMPSLSAAGLATVCWALARLQHRPPAFWLDQVLIRSYAALHNVPEVKGGNGRGDAGGGRAEGVETLQRDSC